MLWGSALRATSSMFVEMVAPTVKWLRESAATAIRKSPIVDNQVALWKSSAMQTYFCDERPSWIGRLPLKIYSRRGKLPNVRQALSPPHTFMGNVVIMQVHSGSPLLLSLLAFLLSVAPHVWSVRIGESQRRNASTSLRERGRNQCGKPRRTFFIDWLSHPRPHQPQATSQAQEE